MNIDDNERPFESPDEEEITDHQTVADVLSNGETYEPVSENREAYNNLTEESLREVVEEILEEAAQAEPTEPHPTQVLNDGLEANEPQPRPVQQIDVSDIPVGMSVERYIELYNQTGGLFTQTTAVPSSYATYTGSGVDTNNSTDATAPTHHPLDDLFVNRDSKEMKEEKEPIKEILPTPEQIARIKAERKLYHDGQLKLKRDIYIRDIPITKDDLIIAYHSGDKTLYHIDVEGTHQMKDVEKPSIARRRGRSVKGISNSFIFDKNMNRLIVNRDRDIAGGKRVTRRDGHRIYPTQVYLNSEGGNGEERFFVVIDKNAFLNSKGRVWKLKRRQGVSYTRIRDAKKMYMKQFDQIERFMSLVKFSIEMVHPAEDYDIMYVLGGQGNHTVADFSLLIKFRDVTISNSIEMDHHIGEMIVKSNGVHYFDDRPEVRSILHGSLTGTRMTFNPGDAGRNYQHSHMTTSMCNFGNFCTGSENYSSGDGYLNEHNIQEHIFRLDTYIRWESLEGGPHFRMENIRPHGGVQPIKKNILGTDREVGNTYLQRLIYEINQTPNKFNTFSHCFVLLNKKGNLKFIADYQMFFRTFMEIIPSDKIKQITTELGERIYTYNSMEGTFHAVDDAASLDPIKVVQKAEHHMKMFTPIYMNGKYHVPRLSTRSMGDLLEGLVFSPEPNIMKEIAQLIMYHLTNKLEEYGNTSTNEREAG